MGSEMTKSTWMICILLICLSLFEMSKTFMTKDMDSLSLTSSKYEAENSDHGYFNRQRRAVTPDFVQHYVADIEISYSDPLLQSAIKSFMENINFTISDQVMLTSVKPVSVCSISENSAMCYCQDGHECVTSPSPLSSCSGNGCTCNTSFPINEHCREVKNMTLTPENPYLGDTLNITCYYYKSIADISWYYNSQLIGNDSRYIRSTSVTDLKVAYTLTIMSVETKDSGTYTCEISAYSYMQSLSVYINSLTIKHSSDVDIVCDGAAFILKCCTGDSNSFSVEWTVTGQLNIKGSTSSNSTCHMYTIQAEENQCPASMSGSATNYKCAFKGIYGASDSKEITVRYFRKAKIEIPAVPAVSETESLTITCQSDVPSADKVEWNKDNMDNIIEITNATIENGTAVSRLEINSTNPQWNGIYYCTFYQNNISSTGNVTVEIVPLPAKDLIFIEPAETLVKCNVEQMLNCCVMFSTPNDFVVTFYSDAFTSRNGTPNVESGQLACYTATVSIPCGKPLKSNDVYCNVTNKLNFNTTSHKMVLKVWNGVSSDQDCKENQEFGLPESPSGENIVIPCKQQNSLQAGNITYTCSDNSWSKKMDCYAASILILRQGIEDLVNGPQAEKQLPAFIENLSVTAQEEKESISNSPTAIRLMVEILSIAANTINKLQEDSMLFFINTVDIVLSNTTTWQSVTGLSGTVLNFVDKIAKKCQVIDQFETGPNNTNVQLKGKTLNGTGKYDQNFTFSNLSGRVELQKSSLVGNSSTIITIAYSTMKDILKTNKSKVVNGLVMSTVVNTEINKELFSINMSFSKHNNELDSPECVYWDFGLSQNGDWSNYNCSTKDENGVVICTCNHLTSFSVLMTGKSSKLLDYITYAGVGTSLLCLVLTLLIEAIVWRSVIKNKTSYLRHVCLVNIAVTLLVADIWFIIGAAFEKYPMSDICLSAAFFGFYFYLCLFFWMLTNGLILFYRMIYILHDMSRKTMMIIAFTLGYICPLIISIITVAVTVPQKGFTSGKYCWLNYKSTMSFLAFIIPALTIVCINFIILVVVICKLLRPSIGERPGKEEKVVLIQITKSIAVLTPLLGLTWGFGILVIAFPESLALHGIFAALNSFQGFFILISTVLLDQKVRRIMGSTMSSLSGIRAKGTTSSSSSRPSLPKRNRAWNTNAAYNIFHQPSSSNQASSESYSAAS